MKRFVLAVDPGGMTGYAWWNTEHPNGPPWSAQSDRVTFLRNAESWLQANAGDVLVICERFTISEGTVRKSREGALETLRIIGALEWITERTGNEFDLSQTPADAKALVTNERLRALGWWKVGEDHSRDALRHLALGLVKRNRLRLEVSA